MGKQIIKNFDVSKLVDILLKMQKKYSRCNVEFDVENADVVFIPTVKNPKREELPPPAKKENTDFEDLAETA